MSERDKQWRKWFDDNIRSTRNEELLYQCWVAAWEAGHSDLSVTLDKLLSGDNQILGKTPSK